MRGNLSTALTLIMVPVMITAPTVVWGQLKSVGRLFDGIVRHRAVAPEGAAMNVADADAGRYVANDDGTGLVETERDGVTTVSRQAAE